MISLSCSLQIKTLFSVFDSAAKPDYIGIQHPTGLKSCPACYIVAVKKRHIIIFLHQSHLFLRQTEHLPTILSTMETERLFELNGVHFRSPLLEIRNLDPFKGSTIDVMHAVDIGVTKRFTNFWFDPLYNQNPYYIAPSSRRELFKHIDSIKSPHNIPRKIRSLINLAKFKASEFSTLLLYIFPIFFHGVLADKFYNHFLLLSFSISKLFLDVITEHDLEVCDRLLEIFVRDCSVLYGDPALTLNTHLLRHLPETVRNIGSLKHVNAYPFENMNAALRGFVTGSCNPGKQIAKKATLKYITKLDQLSNENNSLPKTTVAFKSPLSPEFQDIIMAKFNVNIPYQYSTLHMNGLYFTSTSYKVSKQQEIYSFSKLIHFFYLSSPVPRFPQASEKRMRLRR